jgi:hypothetical protein
LLVDAYLDRVLSLLASAGCEEIEQSDVRISPGNVFGRLRARLRYPGGLVLMVNLAVDATVGGVSWPVYSFHLQDAEERCLFRYDNAPHHSHVATFPHHKHVGDVVQESAQPSVHQVAGEVLQRLAERE